MSINPGEQRPGKNWFGPFSKQPLMSDVGDKPRLSRVSQCLPGRAARLHAERGIMQNSALFSTAHALTIILSRLVVYSLWNGASVASSFCRYPLDDFGCPSLLLRSSCLCDWSKDFRRLLLGNMEVTKRVTYFLQV